MALNHPPENEAASPGDPTSWRFVSRSEDETRALGAILADALLPGTVVALVGHLGAGKTRLVQAVAEAAGVDRAEVNSPTFVLVQEYVGRWPIYHFDTYRLPGPREFLELGAEEYFDSPGVCFVEWADRVASAVPDDVLVNIQSVDATSRQYEFVGRSPRGRKIVQILVQISGKT